MIGQGQQPVAYGKTFIKKKKKHCLAGAQKRQLIATFLSESR